MSIPGISPPDSRDDVDPSGEMQLKDLEENVTGDFSRFPNLFSIGGMRCGSTMLFENLNQHPQVFFPQIKEPDFLLKQYWKELLQQNRLEGEEKERALAIQSKGKIRTMDQYLEMYAASDLPVRGDASHYLYHPGVIDLIKRHVPEPRILVSFRDPIDRLFSEFMYRVRIGRFEGTFAEFVDRGFASRSQGQKSDGLEKGLYFKLLKPWTDSFGREELKIVIFEELSENPREVLTGILQWLDIDPDFDCTISHPEKSGRPTRTGKTIRQMLSSARFARWLVPQGLRKRIRRFLLDRFVVRDARDTKVEKTLREFYRQDLEEFRVLVDRELPGWKTLR